MIDLINQFVFTSSSISRLESNQYTFDVDKKVTKTQIKIFFEKHYNIKVLRVNTYRPPSKKTRIGKYMGEKNSYKRAIITLKSGIEFGKKIIL